MVTEIISDLLSDAAIPLVMLICIRVIFDKKLSLRQNAMVFLTVQMLVMVEHWALRFTYSNDLKGFLIFYCTAFLESATAFAIFAYVCKGDILSRAYLIYALYMQILHGIVGYLCGLSDELAYALKAHIILRESAPIIPIFIIAILHGTVGFLLSIPIRKFTLNLKNGVASCKSEEGRQRISVMFVG